MKDKEPITWEVIEILPQMDSQIASMEIEDFKMEAGFNMMDRHEEDLKNHEFDENDKWEDGSLYGY